MNRLRRSVAAVAGLAVLAQAVGLGVLHWVLGLAVRAQEMSLAGLSSTTMSLTTWIAGALLGLFLLLCAAVLGRAALRDRLGGRPSRALLVGCLVTQAVLATLAVGMAGWAAFAGLMTVFALLLLTLSGYPPVAAAGRHRPPVSPVSPVSPAGEPATDHPSPTRPGPDPALA